MKIPGRRWLSQTGIALVRAAVRCSVRDRKGIVERRTQRLIKGEPLMKMLEADETKEVAVFGAVWIIAPIRRYVEAVKDIETFERGGGFRVTKRISA